MFGNDVGPGVAGPESFKAAHKGSFKGKGSTTLDVIAKSQAQAILTKYTSEELEAIDKSMGSLDFEELSIVTGRALEFEYQEINAGEIQSWIRRLWEIEEAFRLMGFGPDEGVTDEPYPYGHAPVFVAMEKDNFFRKYFENKDGKRAYARIAMIGGLLDIAGNPT